MYNELQLRYGAVLQASTAASARVATGSNSFNAVITDADDDFAAAVAAAGVLACWFVLALGGVGVSKYAL